MTFPIREAQRPRLKAQSAGSPTSRLEAPRDVGEGDPDRATRVSDVKEVQPELTRFVLAHIRLRPPKSLRNVRLPKPRVEPTLSEKFAEPALFCLSGAWHGAAA